VTHDVTAGGATPPPDGPIPPPDGDAECDEVLEDVYVFLDNECDGRHRARIQQHLDDCSPCLARFGLEADLKKLLARKCGGELAPPALRETVRVRIREIVVTRLDAEPPD